MGLVSLQRPRANLCKHGHWNILIFLPSQGDKYIQASLTKTIPIWAHFGPQMPKETQLIRAHAWPRPHENLPEPSPALLALQCVYGVISPDQSWSVWSHHHGHESHMKREGSLKSLQCYTYYKVQQTHTLGTPHSSGNYGVMQAKIWCYVSWLFVIMITQTNLLKWEMGSAQKNGSFSCLGTLFFFAICGQMEAARKMLHNIRVTMPNLSITMAG